jgi:hypothetical protein
MGKAKDLVLQPGPAAAYVLERVSPIRSFAGFSERAEEIRRVRRELDVSIDEAARCSHVPVPELVGVERGILAFATPHAYDVVLERVRGYAAHRARKASAS